MAGFVKFPTMAMAIKNPMGEFYEYDKFILLKRIW